MLIRRVIKLDALTSVAIETAPHNRLRLSMLLGGVAMTAKEISYDHAQQISEALCSVVCAAVGEPDPFPSIPGQ